MAYAPAKQQLSQLHSALAELARPSGQTGRQTPFRLIRWRLTAAQVLGLDRPATCDDQLKLTALSMNRRTIGQRAAGWPTD